MATLKPENALLERKAIQAALELAGGSYAKAGKNLGVNRGTLYAIMNGKRHASNSVRIALGLHPLHVQVDPCPTCGTVTLAETCPVCQPPKPKRARKPEDGVMRVKRVDAARIRALGALYTSRRVAYQRWCVELTRTLDSMTG